MTLRSMLPTPLDNFMPFHALHREVERVFDDFTRDLGWPLRREGEEMFAPEMDVCENETNLTVTAELPGLDEKDVEVTLSDDTLTIKGTKEVKREEKDGDYQLVERSQGAFERSIPIWFEADPNKVQASFSKGILTVTVPKPAEAKSKMMKIPVRSAS